MIVKKELPVIIYAGGMMTGSSFEILKEGILLDWNKIS